MLHLFVHGYGLLMVWHVFLQASRPLRWVPSCPEEWAMATGTLCTFTTTTRWVYASVCRHSCNISILTYAPPVCVSMSNPPRFLTFHLWLLVLYLWCVGMLVSQSAEHFGSSWRVCARGATWAFACHHFVRAYSPYSSFNFLHVLSFSSAIHTLCEYECVSKCTYTSFVSFFSSSQTVSEERVCFCSIIFLPTLSWICLLSY